MPHFANDQPRVIQQRGNVLLSTLNYIVIGSLLLAVFLKFSLHSVPEVRLEEPNERHVTRSHASEVLIVHKNDGEHEASYATPWL